MKESEGNESKFMEDVLDGLSVPALRAIAARAIFHTVTEGKESGFDQLSILLGAETVKAITDRSGAILSELAAIAEEGEADRHGGLDEGETKGPSFPAPLCPGCGRSLDETLRWKYVFIGSTGNSLGAAAGCGMGAGHPVSELEEIPFDPNETPSPGVVLKGSPLTLPVGPMADMFFCGACGHGISAARSG